MQRFSVHNILQSRIAVAFLAAGIGWFVLHIPAVYYGTDSVPMHTAYVGDEQSPINGALHILQQQSPLAIRNLESLYYGPVFAVLAVPAVAFDFLEKAALSGVRSADAYRAQILFDWGGIVWKARVIALLVGFLGLVAFYKILSSDAVSSGRKSILVFVGVLLLAGNFYFFEYASFFRHWVFICTCLLWQVYFLIRIHECPERAGRYFIYQGLLASGAFGFSYFAILSQALFIPSLYIWMKEKNLRMLKLFARYVLIFLVLGAVIIAWHPFAFIRILGIAGNDIVGEGISQYSLQTSGGLSFWYYAKIVLINHWSLLLAGVLLYFQRTAISLGVKTIIWSLGAVGVSYYVVLGLFSHHESRYILPIVLSLVAIVSLLLVSRYSDADRVSRVAIVTSLVVYIAFHGVTIIAWNLLLLNGPPDRVFIEQVLSYQEAHTKSRQVLVGSSLAGWPHTREAYDDFAETFDKTGYSLFEYYAQTDSPDGVTALAVYYREKFGDIVYASYDRAFLHFIPSEELGLEKDFQEVNLTRYWMYREAWRDVYIRIK